MPTKKQTETKIHRLAQSIDYNAILVPINIEIGEVTWQEARDAQRVRLAAPDPGEIVSEQHQTPKVLTSEEAEDVVQSAKDSEPEPRRSRHRW